MVFPFFSKKVPWVEGTEDGNEKDISLVSTPWDMERTSSEVINQVLKEQGYGL